MLRTSRPNCWEFYFFVPVREMLQRLCATHFTLYETTLIHRCESLQVEIAGNVAYLASGLSSDSFLPSYNSIDDCEIGTDTPSSQAGLLSWSPSGEPARSYTYPLPDLWVSLSSCRLKSGPSLLDYRPCNKDVQKSI